MVNPNGPSNPADTRKKKTLLDTDTVNHHSSDAKEISPFIWINSIPNFLTLLRIGVIPILIVCLLKTSQTAHLIGAGCFMIACLTDYLDGYLARVYLQTTRLGEFLDPFADKLLIVSTLFLLAGLNYLSLFSLIPALIIVCREMFISALREFLSSHKQLTLPVTSLAKWKTTFQMIALTILLVRHETPLWIGSIGEWLLWIAAGLAIWTGLQYFQSAFKTFFR